MVVVHVEVVALEGMSVLARVNRVHVHVTLRVLFIEVHDHLVRGHVDGIENGVILISPELAASDIE